MIHCPYCGTSHITEQSNIRKVKDHMFGSKKEWSYLVCNQCRSWILAERPRDEDLYGKNYYTQSKPPRDEATFLEKAWAKYSAGKFSPLGWLIALLKDGKHTTVEAAVKQLGKNYNIRVLDYGCGNGTFVRMMRSLGYKNVFGYDPYLPQSTKYLSQTLPQRVNHPEYDFGLIVSCHSIEHSWTPGALLDIAFLYKASTIILQCPIASGFPGTAVYYQYWVGLDAPRHFAVPTQSGLDFLLSRIKSNTVTRMRRYKITGSYSNTTAFSFSASSAAELGIAWNTKTYKLFGFAYRFLVWGINLFARLSGWIEKTDNNDMMTYTLQLHEESRF